MAFELPPLPYALNALEPVISARTLEFHYKKHHKGYVDKANELVKGTEFEKLSLEDAVVKSAEDPGATAIFNNVAQIWNHTFFWNCLAPSGAQEPSARLKGHLAEAFGGFDEFKKKFAEAAVKRFGSGYAWLVEKPDRGLEIVSTANAETPLTTPARPLLTLDVWEHAYYLDYQNRRPDFAKEVLDKLINWSFVEKNWSEPFAGPRAGATYPAASTLRH